MREQTYKNEELILGPYAFFSKNTKGREKPITPCLLRTDFQRDRDRIIHSKSFRRLKHKTQVFLSPEGDHYRTRLTHTLEVAQIARTIARALRLNEDLTESIALGHDLGHTPFGHAGERVLAALTDGYFEHNLQSLRQVEVLENNGAGLNLTYEVKDGIVQHKKTGNPQTLEGKVVSFSDRIAYINHDIDDAIRGGIITSSDIPANLTKILGNSHGERINTMIMDIVQVSMDTSNISMSDRVLVATNDLRQFMFDRVYVHSLAKEEEKKADKFLRLLFQYFYEHDQFLPDFYRDLLLQWPKQVVICDYIAGMTDRYAVKIFNEIFVPQSWTF